MVGQRAIWSGQWGSNALTTFIICHLQMTGCNRRRKCHDCRRPLPAIARTSHQAPLVNSSVLTVKSVVGDYGPMLAGVQGL
jgi:hypothetical protein